MPWNGSGGFQRSNGDGGQRGAQLWRDVDAAGRLIRTDDHDAHDEDLADGLENCLARDGQNSPSSNLPMNAKKHTGVADATADDQYGAWGQVKSRISSEVSDLENALEPAIETLSDSAQIAWDVGDDPVAEVTLGGNRTLANPSNPVEGDAYILTVKQDGTGSRTLAFGNAYVFGEEGSPTLSTGANKVDVLTFFYRDSKMLLTGIAKGF